MSKCSNFSLKSQQYIARQDIQMEAMKKAMIAAGLDPDAVVIPVDLAVFGLVRGETTDMDGVKSKKRLPSGSPDGKLWDSVNSGSVSDDDDVDLSIKDKIPGLGISDFLKSKAKSEKKMSKMHKKNVNKKAKRLAKAVANHDAAAQVRAQDQAENGDENERGVALVMSGTTSGAVGAAIVDVQSTAVVTGCENGRGKQNGNVNENGNGKGQDRAPDSGPLSQTPADAPPVTVSGPPLLYSHIAASGPSTSKPPNAVHNNDLPALPPVFKTPGPEGPYRDEIVVEILSMDNKEFKGTITPTEARKTIFEDVLGFKQDDLAGVKIGFNRGRIITFKLKQQFDVDELFEWERFSFERSVGNDVSSISCLIRGLKDPGKRKTTLGSARAAQTMTGQYSDDGTRLVKIIGCDYKLLESEILDWLVLFGEILSEITKEIYEDLEDPNSLKLPPVGNGNYLVSMKLKKDLPNWLPIYGRRVCLEYKGNKKQCNWCYGPHLRKFCKNEKMSLDEYAIRFRLQHPTIPEQFYGRLAKFENLNGPKEVQIPATLKPTKAVTTVEPESGTTQEHTALKLSLRRESTPGSSWVKATPASTVTKPDLTQATVSNNVEAAQPVTLMNFSRSAT